MIDEGSTAAVPSSLYKVIDEKCATDTGEKFIDNPLFCAWDTTCGTHQYIPLPEQKAPYGAQLREMYRAGAHRYGPDLRYPVKMMVLVVNLTG
ncbi:hypothetical protein [Pantoea sp. App145]|uniref:hypothetical protein n=1 Tax=Pantoea sp. App145 TaxID=3071567 RepID=UPI003A8136F9